MIQFIQTIVAGTQTDLTLVANRTRRTPSHHGRQAAHPLNSGP